MSKNKIYVGCSLYNADKAFVKEVLGFKDSLRDKYDILDFFPEGEASIEEIVKTDLQNVASCDLFVAICDLPSIGLGVEIGKANELKKHTLLCSKISDISRMVRGNNYENENSRFFVYKSFQDIEKEVDLFFEQGQ